MIMDHYFIVLSCLATAVLVVTAVSPTKSPECDGMNTMKTQLKKGIQTFTKEPTNCLVNGACTGISCNGTHKNEPFYMSIVLQHCMKPDPEIHLDLVYPDKKINKHQEIKQGSSIELYKIGGAVAVKLHLNLKRNQNRITSSLELQMCNGLVHGCQKFIPLIPETTFCVNMNTCPPGQFNTTGYTPCHMTPPPPSTVGPSSTVSPPPSTGQVKTTKSANSSSKPSSMSSTHSSDHFQTTAKVHSSSKPTPHTSGHVKTTEIAHTSLKPTPHTSGHSKTTEKLYTSLKPTLHTSDYVKTTQSSRGNIAPTSAGPGVKGHQKGDGHHHMSVGVAVGIGFAVLACILIVVGVVVYWKKFHHRSRLRAAYYNDISMNDPLCEDFGPEVA